MPSFSLSKSLAHEMFKLYGRLSSINVQKVIWCLNELDMKDGKDYERIDAGLEFGVNKTDAYLKMNPNGLVPLLVDGDFVLWESNAIVRYLAGLYGFGGLMPSDPKVRADADRWMDWSLATLWPALRVAFIGLTRTPKEKQDPNQIVRHYREGTQLISQLDSALAERQFCAGEAFSMGDIALAVAVDRWIKLAGSFPEFLGPLPGYTVVLAWHHRVTARPTFPK